MIGFIAGAGIIVRNSIILVDFIEHQIKSGHSLKDAVVSAGVLRFRPMLLTAAAVVVGSSVMLSDPTFQGLAVSLMFGEIAATLLSRFLVPVSITGSSEKAEFGIFSRLNPKEKYMPIEMQIRAFAGSFILASLALYHFHSHYWLYFTAFVGVNLLQSALPGFVLWRSF